MEQRLQKIRLLLLDVDGVLTDGRIIYGSDGTETKAFDVKDGHGLKMLQRAGLLTGIITGRESTVVLHRARELGIEIVHQAAKDKLIPYRQILSDLGLSDDQVAYVGDDIVDLPILRRVGFAATVADCVEDVREHVHYVTNRPGGRGAVREICDLLLRGGGYWESVAGKYFTV
jgi:3-deoxy-D-manno-octulosonate 8-phosphate phosphatase (KDO 8-P phosphatase)